MTLSRQRVCVGAPAYVSEYLRVQAFFANSDWQETDSADGSDAEMLTGIALLVLALFCDSVRVRVRVRERVRMRARE